MPFPVKLLLSNLIIVGCMLIGRRNGPLAGLVATMPLTSLLVLVWLHLDNPADRKLLSGYTRGVLWGIIPTILFFSAFYLSYRKELPFPAALGVGFAAWLAAAFVHLSLVK
jgi:uncharacterized membrane protein (GlpM family)